MFANCDLRMTELLDIYALQPIKQNSNKWIFISIGIVLLLCAVITGGVCLKKRKT